MSDDKRVVQSATACDACDSATMLIVSKAFTKEQDDAPQPARRRLGVPVPDGANYVTAAGLRALRDEHDALARGPRDSAGDDRLHELADHLATAEVLEPSDRSRVSLGARVTVEDEHGKRTTYRIVGAIEAAPREGAISWQSPIANALWDAQVGDSVTLPRGDDVEIVAIGYQ
jgi:transcription elongation GreA/GreB family factor